MHNPSSYCSHSDSQAVLRLVVSSLGISHYAMAKLLGVRHSNYAQWFTTYRVSSKYLNRICILFAMSNKGLKLPLVDYIDWVNGNIKYKKGVSQHEDQSLLSQFGWGISVPKAEAESSDKEYEG